MGKQIRIYLADGSASGIRHAEVTNWTGQAIACPRSRFPELREWQEVKRPGVYLLFGTSEETGEDAVYIGESEVVLDRLYAHIASKEFWTELIAFTNKDDNLTKAHVKYLESRLIELALKADRYHVTNTASPQLPVLPRADRDAMEEYLESTRTLLGVLGHRVLEPFRAPVRLVQEERLPESSRPPAQTNGALPATERAIFTLRIRDLLAKATRTDEGLVVLAGSEATSEVQGSLSGGYKALREKLIGSGILEQAGSKFKFTKDQLFSSPSQAAAVIVGYAINGRDSWRLDDGSSYSAFEERLSKVLLQEIELTT